MSYEVATPSGKNRQDENFPVASFLIAPHLRRHVHAFYDFARLADDIADNPSLSPEDKIARLDVMEDVLKGVKKDGSESAAKLRQSLQETGISPVHASELLIAFRQDAVKTRYASYEELYDYCRYSAMPVGRYVLDLHGENPATRPASDALCAVLQILNHLQDAQKDLLNLDRCYLPADMLADFNARVDDLRASAASPGLRACFQSLLQKVSELNKTARQLPYLVKDRRLRIETAAIYALDSKLTSLLYQNDPVASRAALKKKDFLLCGLLSLRFFI